MHFKKETGNVAAQLALNLIGQNPRKLPAVASGMTPKPFWHRLPDELLDL